MVTHSLEFGVYIVGQNFSAMWRDFVGISGELASFIADALSSNISWVWSGCISSNSYGRAFGF